MANLRSTLLAWRENEASKKGVELFRVLPTSAIDDIVRAMPKTKEELTAIKGIKDAKFAQYGMAILHMVKDAGSPALTPKADFGQKGSRDTMTPISYIVDGQALSTPKKEERKFYSVSSYLDIVNRELWRLRAPIKGEITSFKFQGNAVYFSMRDNEDGAVLSVFMWTSDFTLSGIALAEGLEVVVEGRGEIYKPSGRFNFRAETIELVGEGAYKKAYDDLKKKLESEGLFSLEKKRKLGELPVRIGLITSQTGAVIHDFLNNLGRFGYHTLFVDARVEGSSAVKDILSALETLESKNLDALVLVRGGGSLESLQAFNNEHVVRAIARFPAVTICAIGHDKDVPLAQLVADYAPSTPTATTVLLNASWERCQSEVSVARLALQSASDRMLRGVEEELRMHSVQLGSTLERIFAPFREASAQFSDLLFALAKEISRQRETLTSSRVHLAERFLQSLKNIARVLDSTKSIFALYDPERQLRLGYSILTKNGRILRNIEDIAKGEHFEARIAGGTLEAELIQKHQK
jgi:exodeoxyribonuclease VII large subunit